MKLNPPHSRNRSRRMRKKLRVGEFQELGFTIDVALVCELTETEELMLLNTLISEVVEPRNLSFGGGISGGYIVSAHRASATEADRDAVRDWLQSRPELSFIQIGSLEDAWHGHAQTP